MQFRYLGLGIVPTVVFSGIIYKLQAYSCTKTFYEILCYHKFFCYFLKLYDIWQDMCPPSNSLFDGGLLQVAYMTLPAVVYRHIVSLATLTVSIISVRWNILFH